VDPEDGKVPTADKGKKQDLNYACWKIRKSWKREKP
jgi:hypothetical protein